MDLLRLIREPKFESDLEREFVLLSIHDKEAADIRLSLIFSLITPLLVWVGIATIGSFKYRPELSSFILGYAVISMVSASALSLPINASQLRWTILITHIVAQFNWLTGLVQADLPPYERLIFILAWASFTGISAGMLPFRNYYHHILLIFHGTLAFAGHHYTQHPKAAFVVYFIAWLVGSNYSIIVHRSFKLQAIDAFRQQLRLVPKQVILEAIRTEVTLDEVFHPAKRECIFLSSDWWRFKEIAQNADPERLSQLMGNYYDGVMEILDHDFPNGNYFADFMADEILITFLLETDQTADALHAQVLSFAHQLLRYRKDFSKVHSDPHGIDIGISYGSATVGIIGPKNRLKATALGEAPCMARRLQCIAKQLRSTQIDTDRIVSQHLNSTPAVIESFDIVSADGDFTMKDVEPTEKLLIFPKQAA